MKLLNVRVILGSLKNNMTKQSILFFDSDNCRVCVQNRAGTMDMGEWFSGITDKIIGDFITSLQKLGYQITLYRISKPEFFGPKD